MLCTTCYHLLIFFYTAIMFAEQCTSYTYHTLQKFCAARLWHDRILHVTTLAGKLNGAISRDKSYDSALSRAFFSEIIIYSTGKGLGTGQLLHNFISTSLNPLSDSWYTYVKDRVPQRQQAGVVYQTPCGSCPKVYIGQIGRTLDHHL